MATVVKNKVSVKELTTAKKILATDDIGSRLFLGTIIGIASGIKDKLDTDKGEMYEFFVGEFEAVPSETDKDTVKSGRCFLPEAIHEMLRPAFMDEKGEERKDVKVNFAFEVYAERATNKAGFTYVCEPVVQPQADTDPLAELRAQLAAKKESKALPAPAADPAPAAKAPAKK